MDKPCVSSLEKLQETYRNDRFATQAAHCRIVEATADHVVCEMPIEDVHLNAHNAVMGGRFRASRHVQYRQPAERHAHKRNPLPRDR